MKYAFFCFVALLCFACKKEKDLDQLQTSERVFENFKASSKNSYRYVSTQITTIGINPTYNETTITVTNGKITGREYAVYPITAINSTTRVAQFSFAESGSTVGTHAEGAPLLTLDDIYTKAQTEWLSVDTSKYNITFKTDNNGMISVCGYSPIGCQDDCFRGINIKSITAL